MAYYIQIQNNQIVDCSTSLLKNGINIEVSKEIFDDYEQDKYIYKNGEIVLNPQFEEIKAQEERERIQELLMTRSDFFDATIKAWRMRDKELLALIENLLKTLPIDEVTKMIAINNFENAQNFYRKHDLFSIIVNVPIQLTETTQVIITNEHLDRFFDEVNKGNKATAWEHLPLPTLIEVEENNTAQAAGASADTTEYSYDDV